MRLLLLLMMLTLLLLMILLKLLDLQSQSPHALVVLVDRILQRADAGIFAILVGHGPVEMFGVFSPSRDVVAILSTAALHVCREVKYDPRNEMKIPEILKCLPEQRNCVC